MNDNGRSEALLGPHVVLDIEIEGPCGARAARSCVASWSAMTARPNAGSSELVLAVSELVSNALQYALQPCWLRLLTSGASGWVRVEVEDANPAPPIMGPAVGPECGHGRGLRIVEAVSNRWGATPGRRGKVVWCEFDPPIMR